MSPARVFTVIPSYNRKEKTSRCIESLLNCDLKDIDLHIVLVDDLSTDGTVELIVKRYPQVTVLRGDGSYYWTKAINTGVRYSIDDCAEYVLVLNDDTVHDPGFLVSMLSVSRKFDAIVGSAILYLSKPDKIRFAGSAWSLKKLGWFYPDNMNSLGSLPSQPFSVSSINGNSCLIPAKTFCACGLFDESNFPHYYADSEFTFRCGNLGIPLLVDSNSLVWDDDSDVQLRSKPISMGFICLLQYVFLRRTSEYYYKGFFFFTTLTAPNLFLGFALYFYRITRLFAKILMHVLHIRPYYNATKI